MPKKSDNSIDDLIESVQKEIDVKEAALKDGVCNYKYEQMTGPRKGNQIKEQGSSLVHEEMNNAFASLNVHLAILDDAFTPKGVSKKSIDDLSATDETELYSLTGFKVDENSNVVLIGSKQVTHGHIDFSTPKVNLAGAYIFRDELASAIEILKDEVYAYYNGKTAPKMEQAVMEFDEFKEVQ
jgi:hypothetical protein